MRTLILMLLIAASAGAQTELGLTRLRDYTNHRAGSYDRSGGNDDGNWGNPIKAGEVRTLAELEGPGVISHIWFTMARVETWHLKTVVLRMYWDGESTPSVEVPIGDFFGLGLGEYFLYESDFLSVGSQKALNVFFPMPFRQSARFTVENQGSEEVGAFYYNIDYEKHERLDADIAYFHAQYRQQTPTDGFTNEWERNGEEKINTTKNPVGDGNYVIMEAEGRSHYLGVVHSIQQNQGDWWGEGDEMIFIDGETSPSIIGTGSEDYYLGAWCYGGCGINPFGGTRPTFAYGEYGNPMNGGDDRGAKWMVYRFHPESPIVFQRDIKVTIEHGHANHRSDNFYTVGFWYQEEPHKAFPALPTASERIPHHHDVGGPTKGRN